MSYALELATTPRGGEQRCAGGALRWVRRILVFAALVCGFWLLGALLDNSSAAASSPAQSPVTTADSSHSDPLLGGLVAQLEDTTTQLTTTVDHTVPGTVHDVVTVVHHTIHSVVHDTVAPTVQQVVRTTHETVKTVEKTLTNTGHSLPAPVTNPVHQVGQTVGAAPGTVVAPRLPKAADRTAATPRQHSAASPAASVPSNVSASAAPAARHHASHSRTLFATHRGALGTSASHRLPQPSAPSTPVPAPVPDKGVVEAGTAGSSRTAQNDLYVLGSDAPRGTPSTVSRVRHEARTLHSATNSRPDVSPD